MKIIVGLGNPDKKYQNTFHNLGFMALDNLAKKLGIGVSKKKCQALIGEGSINGEKIILAKPQTYMNLSGESVRELMSFYKIDVEDLLVIFDDFDLPKGTLRIRKEGSAGTHNGMRNIVDCIKSTFFPRIRIGFMPNDKNIPKIDYVLSGISKEDKEIFEVAIDRAGDAGLDFCKGETLDKIMQKYN